MKNIILILALLLLSFSCGKLPEDALSSGTQNRVGGVFSANPNEMLSETNSLTVSSLCNQLKTKQSTLFAKYYANPSATFLVKTYEKACGSEEGTSLNMKGKLKLEANNLISMVSAAQDTLLIFNDIVTNTHVSLEGFCSAAVVDGKLPTQYRLGSVLRSIAVIPNNQRGCLASSGLVCLSVATAFERPDGAFKVQYEDIFVLDEKLSSETLEIRRDLIRSCDSAKGVSIRSQYLK